MKSPFLPALAGLLCLAVGVTAWADVKQNSACAGYHDACAAYSCQGGVTGNCPNGSPYTAISQDKLVLGLCYPGTGTCDDSKTFTCTTNKYKPVTLCNNLSLVCTSTSSPTGCQ